MKELVSCKTANGVIVFRVPVSSIENIGNADIRAVLASADWISQLRY